MQALLLNRVFLHTTFAQRQSSKLRHISRVPDLSGMKTVGGERDTAAATHLLDDAADEAAGGPDDALEASSNATLFGTVM